jgi:hypothetical protein
MKIVTAPSWDTPAFRVVREVNHEALRWQIAQCLSELSPPELKTILDDPNIEDDRTWDIVFAKIGDRIEAHNVGESDRGIDTEFDQAFDVELHRQIAELVSSPGAIAA